STLFIFMAFFSVNLFLLNMLPVPVLDGGHVLFLLIEAVRGEAISLRVQELLLKVGVSALVALMGYVVLMDVWRVVGGWGAGGAGGVQARGRSLLEVVQPRRDLLPDGLPSLGLGVQPRQCGAHGGGIGGGGELLDLRARRVGCVLLPGFEDSQPYVG